MKHYLSTGTSAHANAMIEDARIPGTLKFYPDLARLVILLVYC